MKCILSGKTFYLMTTNKYLSKVQAEQVPNSVLYLEL